MSESMTVFDTLNEAIAHAFKIEQSSILTLARICAVLSLPNLYIKSRHEVVVSCSTITRRRISSTLSSSELFVRAGPARAGLWAIRPNNPFFLSDAALGASIHQMLTSHGPLTLEQLGMLTDLGGVDCAMLEAFLVQHADEYSRDGDGSFWFTGRIRPAPCNFESMGHALLWAFSEFPDGASVEEMHRLLCLSTVGGSKRITRRSVSRELSRRTDLFMHSSRARYVLIRNVDVEAPAPIQQSQQEPTPPATPEFKQLFPSITWSEPSGLFVEPFHVLQAAPCTIHDDEDEFNPFSFFRGTFEFTRP
jgi:hypothetical protein